MEITMLYASNDSKTRSRPNQKNTFGLLPGPQGSCPGATCGKGGCWAPLKEGAKCSTCYVDRLMRARPNVKNILQKNWDFLKSATEAQMTDALAAEFTRFQKAEEKAGATKSFYRIHWSGDIFSVEYGRALTKAMTKFPGVSFWIYSRSWDLVDPAMTQLKNVSFLLSLDPVNCDQGLDYLTHRKPIGARVGISYMGSTLPESLKAYMQANKLRVFECPVDSNKGLALEAACQKCTRCLTPSNFVILFET